MKNKWRIVDRNHYDEQGMYPVIKKLSSGRQAKLLCRTMNAMNETLTRYGSNRYRVKYYVENGAPGYRWKWQLL